MSVLTIITVFAAGAITQAIASAVVKSHLALRADRRQRDTEKAARDKARAEYNRSLSQAR